MLESEYSSNEAEDNDAAAKLDANGNPMPGGGNNESSKKHKRGKKSKRGQKNADANGAHGGNNDNDADWNGGSNDAIYDTDADGGVWSRDECYKVENLEQDDQEKPANSEAEASVKKEEEVNNANSGEESTTKNSTDTETKEKDEPSAAANIRDLEWAKNAKELLGDENYKKHLIYQANRILLRLRQLRLSAMRMRLK